MSAEAETVFEGWAILELMGHRRLAGWVREVDLAGQGMLRLDVPAADPDAAGDAAWVATQFYSPSALYCLTPTTEEIARAIAIHAQPEPVTRWELPSPRPLVGDEVDDELPLALRREQDEEQRF